MRRDSMATPPLIVGRPVNISNIGFNIVVGNGMAIRNSAMYADVRGVFMFDCMGFSRQQDRSNKKEKNENEWGEV